jgi:hypothetical protein
MKIEFLKDSPELDEFVKTLKWKDSVDFEGDMDDYYTFNAVYFQESTGKYFKIEMTHSGGIYSKARFAYHRRNFRKDEPYVATFYEVKPIEVTITEWEDV